MGSKTTVEAPQPTVEERALQKEQVELLRLQRESIDTQQDFNRLITPVLLEESGFDITLDEEGNITDLQRREDPNAPLRQDIETRFLERTQAALKGELPVNPALLRDLDEQEQNLENQLRNQFGDLTSTPAQEALQRSQESRNLLLESARRGDLTLAEQLQLARQQGNQSLINQTVNRGLSIGQTGNQFANQFGNAVRTAGAAQQPFQFQRQMQFQANQFNAQQSDPFGSILGVITGIAGGAFAGGLGSGAAAKIFQ